MKTKLELCGDSLLAAKCAGVLLACALLWNPCRLNAAVPEPDNILYGTIALAGAPVLASQTNVIVEARRTTNGPAIGSYRMGSDPQVGNFYSLKVKLQSVPPLTDPDASQNGDTLWIVLRDPSGIRGQTNFTIVERGEVQRIDFGMAVGDSDGDGIPDDWELRWFTNLGTTPGTVTSNGLTVLQNFIAGNDPNNTNDGFRLHIHLTNQLTQLKRVWFIARAAEGPGYQGMTRRYTLQFSSVVSNGFWTDVPDYVNLAGTNQTVNYFTANVGQGFYRGCIRLDGFVVPVNGGDTDGDGLPDTWETVYFGNLTRNGTFVGVNGRRALDNYLAGTDPNNPNSQFRLNIANNQQSVSFLGLRAQGAGYEGRTRFYALEASTNPAGTYLPVPGYGSVIGNDQLILYVVPGSSPTLFFRGRAWLVGP